MITFNKISETYYSVSLKDSSTYIGDILREVDGFFVYYPRTNGGFWSEEMLYQIAKKLHDLNEPWKKTIDEYFTANPTPTNS